MRIGIFSDAYLPEISGVVTSVLMLYDGLRKLGHEVFIFTTNLDTETDKDEFEANVIKFNGISIPIKALSSYKSTTVTNKKIMKIAEFNLDVIHIQTEFTIGRLGLLAGKKLGIPIVYTLHTLYEDYIQYISKSMDKYFHDQFLKTACGLTIVPIQNSAIIKIVPTKKVLAHISKYGITGDVRVVPSGLDLDRFDSTLFTEEEKHEVRKSLGLSDSTFIFLSLGRISKEKSLDVVARSYAKICKDTDSRLVFIGDGPYLNELKNLVSELGIDKYVIFTGFIEWKNVPIYYQISNTFVNASTSETQGLTYIEALASGLPLLVQKDECLDGVVEDGYNGTYFNGENELPERMKLHLENNEYLKKVKENTAKSVAKYSKICYANNILNVYIDAIHKYKFEMQE